MLRDLIKTDFEEVVDDLEKIKIIDGSFKFFVNHTKWFAVHDEEMLEAASLGLAIKDFVDFIGPEDEFVQRPALGSKVFRQEETDDYIVVAVKHDKMTSKIRLRTVNLSLTLPEKGVLERRPSARDELAAKTSKFLPSKVLRCRSLLLDQNRTKPGGDRLFPTYRIFLEADRDFLPVEAGSRFRIGDISYDIHEVSGLPDLTALVYMDVTPTIVGVINEEP